jgi:hypothetical protein
MFCRKIFSTIILLMFYACNIYGQGSVTGKIFNKKNNDIIVYATVHNLTRSKFNVSDAGGNYKIVAALNDTLIFSSAGYFPDTIIVNATMMSLPYNVLMAQKVVVLPTAIIDENNYQLDSLKRREDYYDFYKSPATKFAGGSTPEKGFGIVFSPFTFFSSKERQKRKLRKRLAEEEEGYYIDYRFSKKYIADLTRLKNDSLVLFIDRYRPSYKFCRRSSRQDMLFYVSNCMKKFMKRE